MQSDMQGAGHSLRNRFPQTQIGCCQQERLRSLSQTLASTLCLTPPYQMIFLQSLQYDSLHVLNVSNTAPSTVGMMNLLESLSQFNRMMKVATDRS